VTPAPVKPPIPWSTLEEIDIRVGTIERVEEVPKSDKLVRLTVDFGTRAG
jgi:tRNA-binding EMAP/Myf-like protein